jgi:predicted HTH domain antitoxin
METLFSRSSKVRCLFGLALDRGYQASVTIPRVRLQNMEVTLRIPDDIAQRLSAAGGDVSRRALEALALEGYRDQSLTLYQVSEMLGLSRVETEDFLGQHHIPLAVIGEEDLDREAAVFEAASRHPR